MMLKRTIEFGKVDYTNSGKKNCMVDLEVELRDTIKGPELSICGDIWNPCHTDSYRCGQCLDEIAKYKGDNPLFKELYQYWKDYHLNSMHAGTVEQEQALKKAGIVDYAEACEYLKSINLYEVEYNGKPYEYGHGWLYQALPENVLSRITEIIKAA